jgi:hypothetical protein
MPARVSNQDRRFGSADSYLHIFAEGQDYLFTDAELERAKDRAERNLEDLPVPQAQQDHQDRFLKTAFKVFLAVVLTIAATLAVVYGVK